MSGASFRGLARSVGALVLLGLSGCPCRDTDVRRVPSPGGDWVAIASRTDCGATFASTHTVTLETGRLLPNAKIFGGSGMGAVDLLWTGPRALTIRCLDLGPRPPRAFAARASGLTVTLVDCGKGGATR